MKHQDGEHQVVSGDELGAREDDHHQTEGDPEPAEHQVVLAGGTAPATADLGGHQGTKTEEQTTQHGQEEQLEMAVLRFLLRARDELLQDFGVGELRAARKRHGHAAGLDAGHCESGWGGGVV